MTPSTHTQRLFAWAGPAIMVIWMGGWIVFAGLVPPPSPADSAEEIARFYRDNPDGIKVGLTMSIFASTLIAPFVTVITLQLRRAEGRDGPWTLLQFVLGVILVLAFITPLFFLLAASFRADRDPTEVQALNDLGWIMFMGFVSTAVLELVATGFAMLKDPRADPVFPRWVAYVNIWAGLMFCPGAVNVFFFDGPLAWDGLFIFWVPLTAFTVWTVVMTTMLLRAIAHQEREEARGGHVAALGGLAGSPVDVELLALEIAEHLAARPVADASARAPASSVPPAVDPAPPVGAPQA